jgi:hypothetical protein
MMFNSSFNYYLLLFIHLKPNIMNTNKFLIGGILGGIVVFLLGWLVWGMLLKDFMATNAGTATGVMRPDDQVVWWSLVVGNLFNGFAVSYVLSKAGVNNAGTGAAVGAVVGLLVAAAFDFTMYGVSNLSTVKGALVDIGANTIVTAIVGAIVGAYFGMGRKVAVA